MKNADPRVKLLWIVLCTTGAVLFTEPWWMLGLSLFSLVGALLLGADLLSLARRLVKFLPVLAFIVVVQVFFGRGGSPLVAVQGRVLITAEGLQRGAAAALRFFVILCSGAVMMGEDSRRVINSLSQLGVPYMFCFSLFVALRFLPSFSEAFSQALTALQLRGVDLKKVPWRQKLGLYSALILPVLSEALARAEKLAVVMEARGFGALPRRTIFGQARMDRMDWAAVFVLLTLGAAALRLYYA